MKRIISVCFAASMLLGSLAGCAKKADDAKSKVDSGVSAVVSGGRETVSDIGEGITKAVSGVVSEADRMYDNGQVSDGDGIIGNEDETEDTTEPEDTTDITYEESQFLSME